MSKAPNAFSFDTSSSASSEGGEQQPTNRCPQIHSKEEIWKLTKKSATTTIAGCHPRKTMSRRTRFCREEGRGVIVKEEFRSAAFILIGASALHQIDQNFVWYSPMYRSVTNDPLYARLFIFIFFSYHHHHHHQNSSSLLLSSFIIFIIIIVIITSSLNDTVTYSAFFNILHIFCRFIKRLIWNIIGIVGFFLSRIFSIITIVIFIVIIIITMM